MKKKINNQVNEEDSAKHSMTMYTQKIPQNIKFWVKDKNIWSNILQILILKNIILNKKRLDKIQLKKHLL